MSIMITTTIIVRPPNVVPICPTSTSTQLLVHPHGGVIPRIIDLEHWKNYLVLKCAIIHYLLWGTQLRQTWVTRVSQSDSSQKKKTQLVFGKYLSEGSAASQHPNTHQRHSANRINCMRKVPVVILLKAFWTLFNLLVLFHEVSPIISPICCIFKIGVSPSSLVLHRLRPIRSADLKSQRASTGRPIGRSLISGSGAHPIVFFITQVLQVRMKRQESVLLIPATGFEDFTPGSLKCECLLGSISKCQHALFLSVTPAVQRILWQPGASCHWLRVSNLFLDWIRTFC